MPRWVAQKSKYRNVKVEVDGYVFDSKREAARWGELKILAMAGEIMGLVNQHQNKDQCTFPLHGKDGSVVCKYVVDFVYMEGGRKVAEDVKGMATAVYAIKKKLFIAEYGREWLHRES